MHRISSRQQRVQNFEDRIEGSREEKKTTRAPCWKLPDHKPKDIVKNNKICGRFCVTFAGRLVHAGRKDGDHQQ